MHQTLFELAVFLLAVIDDGVLHRTRLASHVLNDAGGRIAASIPQGCGDNAYSQAAEKERKVPTFHCNVFSMSSVCLRANFQTQTLPNAETHCPPDFQEHR